MHLPSPPCPKASCASAADGTRANLALEEPPMSLPPMRGQWGHTYPVSICLQSIDQILIAIKRISGSHVADLQMMGCVRRMLSLGASQLSSAALHGSCLSSSPQVRLKTAFCHGNKPSADGKTSDTGRNSLQHTRLNSTGVPSPFISNSPWLPRAGGRSRSPFLAAAS